MSLYAEAAKGVPFSNGTEGMDWFAKWCSYCVFDHSAHDGSYDNGGCEIVCWMYSADPDESYPECLIPHPPRMWGWMVCTRFKPCTEGDCTGDPAPEERAERVATVQAKWREVMA